MDIDEDDFNETFVELNLNFKGIRVMGEKLIPANWTLKTELFVEEAPEDEQEHQDFLVQVALAKVKFWFNHVVDGSILMNRDNDWAQRAFLSDDGTQSVDNNIVLLPDDPIDQTLAEVFQSKMNALADGAVVFGSVKVSNDDTTGLSILFSGIGELNLPEMEEWVGKTSYFSKPWWVRNDASTIDVIPDETADLTDLPGFAYSLDFIADALRPAKEHSARIIRPEFRPEVIEGGKKDV